MKMLICLLLAIFVRAAYAQPPVGICPEGYVVVDGYCVVPETPEEQRESCTENIPETGQVYTCIPAKSLD